MASRILLSNFVTLGQQLYMLINPQMVHIQTYAETMQPFLKALLDCNLPRTHYVAQPLNNVISVPADPRTGFMTGSGIAHYKAVMAPILQSLYAEADEKELTAISRGAVSQQLRNLPDRITLNDTQSRLRDETVLCIEAGAYRAAAVMGWNLAYDVIRQWVFDSRLNAFNDALVTHTTKAGVARYAPIGDYDDFFKGEPSEATVIETCFMAQIFKGKIRDNLRQHLRRRNDYAHRSFTQPTAEQANAYLHDLMDIITAPPFV
jgi:hypothetical protein